MSSQGVATPDESRLRRRFAWFDREAAAVVTILLGLFQILLSVPLVYIGQTLPKFFVVPLVIGILIMAGGSFAIANERNSSRLLLQGCAYSNVVGLLAALLAFCLYCYSLGSLPSPEPCEREEHYHYYRYSPSICTKEMLRIYCWNITLLLVLYDLVAIIMHGLLSVTTFKALN